MVSKKLVVNDASALTTVEDTSVKIAVMNNDIKHINETLGRLEGKFDAAINNFVTSDQLATQLANSNEKHKEQDKRINDLVVVVTALKQTDDQQQGSIDASRRFVTTGLALLAIAVTAVAAYVGLHK